MQKKHYFIIDFDSTFIKKEALEELAEIVLKNNPNKGAILSKIKKITKDGMEGKIGFFEELSERLKLLKINKTHIPLWVKKLRREVTDSIRRNKQFFKENKEQIYIISGAFKECIVPIVTKFDIREDHVFANTFIFNQKGFVIGVDDTNPLSQDNGKVRVIRSLKLDGEVSVVGDGHSDYVTKKFGSATKFIAFTENIERKAIVKKADHIAPSFDEFLYINKLPTAISYPKNRVKVLLFDNVSEIAVSLFEKTGYPVEYFEKPLTEETLKEKIQGAWVIGVRAKTKLTLELVHSASKLLCAGRYGIGVDNIDTKACMTKGIAVFNAPYSSTRSVVELVIGNIIALMRRTFDKSQKLHNGMWDKSTKDSYEVRGKTLGIIGYGNIGSQLSILAESLGMRVIFYDIVEKMPLGNAQKCETLGELLKISDVASIHMAGNTHVIGERELSRMKDSSYIINTSRGNAIDLKALWKYIKSGKIKGAALDVFPYEPKGSDEPFVSEVTGLENVILTPHIGGSTQEAQKNIAEFVTGKMIDFIETGNTYLSVNFPNIQLPKMIKVHRLLHIHDNVPGILARINGILAKHKINIEGQYLKTNETIGYVITDVNKKYEKQVLQELKKIPHTIRFRVLY